MKTNVYTTAMLGVAFAACLSACSTKSDVNGKEMTGTSVNQTTTAMTKSKGIDYINLIGRVSEDAKVYDGEDTIILPTNNVEIDDSMSLVSTSVVI